MNRILLLLSLIILFFPAFSQDFDNYQPVTAQGTVPKEFRTLSSEKYERALDTMSREGKRFERKAKERFYLESNFLIDELLKSGKVLFNDSITSYVNEVATKVLQSEDGLMEKLRVYVVNSSAVNAFTTNNGIIFVNMGLLAKLETEAQLAFIICHEAIHYKNKHVIKSYVQEKKIDKDPGLFKERASLDERLMAKSNYSIKNELEADKEGLEIFMKSDYRPEAAIEAFKLLRTGYLPFSPSRKFVMADFKSKYFPYDSTMIIDSLYIDVDDDADEDEKDYDTHPNIADRIEQGEKIIGKNGDPGMEDYLFSKNRFKRIRDMARFELCRLFLLSRDYERSLYCAYNLMEEFPESYYLETIIMRSIYGTARLHKSGEFHDLIVDVHANPYPIQPYSQFLSNIPTLGASILATEWVLPLLNHNEDDHAKQLILGQLVGDHYHAVEDEEVIYFEDTSYVVEPIVEQLRTDFPLYNDVYEDTLRENEKRRRRKRPDFMRKTLVLDPLVYKIDLRNDNPVGYLDSEESLVNFSQYIKDCAEAANIRVDVLNTTDIRKNEVNEFNEVRFLKQMREDKFMDESGIVSVDHNKCYAISKKYDTENLSFIGSIELTDKKKGVAGVLAFSIIYLPTLPFGIAYALTPEREYMNVMVVFDLENDKIKKSTYHLKKSNDSAANIKSSIYYNFRKLK